MGILNFSSLLRKYPVEKKIFLSSFRGQKIAIDLPYFLISRLFISQKNVISTTDLSICELDRSEIIKKLLAMTIEFVLSFLELNIEPILVMDGISPKAKEKTKNKRREKQQKVMDDIKKLEEELKSFPILEKPSDKLQRLKELLAQRSFLFPEEKEQITNTLSSLGLKVIQATDEGEKLCSVLCLSGVCSSVYSKDSDCFSFGCCCLIKEIGFKKFDHQNGIYDRELTVIYLKDLLTALELNHQEFVDLCIMSGTDYGSNIPRIGIIKSLQLIKKHGSIDNLPKELDITCLNHKECREIFSVKDYHELILNGSIEQEIKINPDIRDILSFFNLDIYTDQLISGLNEVAKNVKNFNNGMKLKDLYVKSEAKEEVKEEKKRPRIVINFVSEV